MIRVTGGNSLMMSSLNTETDNEVLFNAMHKETEVSGTSKTLENRAKEYSEVKDAATELQSVAAYLSGMGDELLTQLLENGDRSELNDKLKTFVSGYNNLLDQLEGLDTDKADRYADQLKSIMTGQSELLSEVGITANDKGALSVDEEKLSQADAESLKKLLTGSESVAGQVAERSMYIGANAVADQYVDACSNYTASGTAADYAQMVNMIGSYLDSLS